MKDLNEAYSLLENTIPNVPRGTMQGLLRYIDLVMSWNSKINLTGAKTPQSFFFNHICDCFGASTVLNDFNLWMDIGTGAGLPGIVWALLFPEKHFLLVEVSKKRSSFLYRAVVELGLKNIQILNQTIESLSAKELSQFGFNQLYLVSRGTFAPQDLLLRANALAFPWRAWLIFSNPKIHAEYLTLSTSFGIRVKSISYQVPGITYFKDLSILTRLEKNK